jgi:hypothetical protein
VVRRPEDAWEDDVYERFWGVAVGCVAAAGFVGTCAVTSWLNRRVAAHLRVAREQVGAAASR